MVVCQAPTPRRRTTGQVVCKGATALRDFMETAISEKSHVQRCQLYCPCLRGDAVSFGGGFAEPTVGPHVA